MQMDIVHRLDAMKVAAIQTMNVPIRTNAFKAHALLHAVLTDVVLMHNAYQNNIVAYVPVQRDTPVMHILNVRQVSTLFIVVIHCFDTDF